jgi:lysyl-tRNA synthetase class 2
VERFEVYIDGIELCNAFGELTDPNEQRRRLEADLSERRRRGLPLYPIDEKFLSALVDLPASAGIALGVDRLAMMLFGARDIREVVPFTFDEL